MKKYLTIFLICATSSFAQSPCEIGDILFYDQSCGKKAVENKHPIGVVLAPVRRVAVSLNQNTLQWSTNRVDLEISPPKGFMSNINSALDEFSGQELAATFNEFAPNFYPAVRNCSAMDWVKSQTWYLPELGLVNQLYQNKDVINKTLKEIKGADLISASTYWSGSQKSYSQSWQQNFFNGEISYNYNDKKAIVRCVISY